MPTKLICANCGTEWPASKKKSNVACTACGGRESKLHYTFDPQEVDNLREQLSRFEDESNSLRRANDGLRKKAEEVPSDGFGTGIVTALLGVLVLFLAFWFFGIRTINKDALVVLEARPEICEVSEVCATETCPECVRFNGFDGDVNAYRKAWVEADRLLRQYGATFKKEIEWMATVSNPCNALATQDRMMRLRDNLIDAEDLLYKTWSPGPGSGDNPLLDSHARMLLALSAGQSALEIVNYCNVVGYSQNEYVSLAGSYIDWMYGQLDSSSVGYQMSLGVAP